MFLHTLYDVLALVPYASTINPGLGVLASALMMFGIMVWWTIDAEKQRSKPE